MVFEFLAFLGLLINVNGNYIKSITQFVYTELKLAAVLLAVTSFGFYVFWWLCPIFWLNFLFSLNVYIIQPCVMFWSVWAIATIFIVSAVAGAVAVDELQKKKIR